MLTTRLHGANFHITQYQFKHIPSLGGSYHYGRAINNQNIIAGDAYLSGDNTQHGYYSDGDINTDISFSLNNIDSIAWDLNNHGQIAGHLSSQRNNTRIHHGFCFDIARQQLTLLDTLGGASSFAYGINDHHQIVGYSHTTHSANQAFICNLNDKKLKGLGTLGGNHSVAYAVNNHGDVVGYASINLIDTHAFLMTDNTMHDIGTLGGTTSVAYDINDHGLIVGSSYTKEGEEHAFIYNRHCLEPMHDIGTLGGTVSIANAANNTGQVVGYAFLKDNTEAHAFLYHDGKMVDLNQLLDQQAKNDGWVLNEALDINDQGNITGIAYNNRLTIPSCAFMLTVDIAATDAYGHFLSKLQLIDPANK